MLRVSAIFLTGLAVGAVATLAFRVSPGGDASKSSAGNPSPTKSAADQAAKPGSIAGLSARHSVAAIGTIEPRDGIVQIGSALVGFQIKQIHVKEGQLVKAGDLLIELDSAVAEVEHDLAVSLRRSAGSPAS